MNTLSFLIKSPSKWLIVLIACVVVGINNNQKLWENKGVIVYDVISYYSYLPATFIEKDIRLSFLNETTKDTYHQGKYWPLIAPNGAYVIKTTMGMSVLYAPFFFMAHSCAKWLDYPNDGFSLPYQFAVHFSGLFYLVLGLWFLRKVLVAFYSETIVTLTLGVIFLGTNLLCYSTLQAATSHQYTFFLFSLFLFSVWKWLNKSTFFYSLLLGLTVGLLVLVRPINVLFVVVILLYNITSFASLKDRLLLFYSNFKWLLFSAFISFLVFLPQLLYWKAITGHYFFNSYIGEWFYFLKPHLWQCLVGFRKGWLIYTPLMLLVFPGIYFLYKNKSPWAAPSLAILVIHLYLVSSWWCWWYGGSFGLRPMIDIYPILSFPIAAFFMRIMDIAFRKRVILFGAIIVLVLLNFFQTIQFHYNVIHYDSMTFKAYVNRFFLTSRFDAERSYLERPDYKLAMEGIDGVVPFEGE